MAGRLMRGTMNKHAEQLIQDTLGERPGSPPWARAFGLNTEVIPLALPCATAWAWRHHALGLRPWRCSPPNRGQPGCTKWALPSSSRRACAAATPGVAASAFEQLSADDLRHACAHRARPPESEAARCAPPARHRRRGVTPPTPEAIRANWVDLRIGVELARAQLLYGQWLRREGRRADARAQLLTAYEALAAMGVEAFADRARHELAATGETVRRMRCRDERRADSSGSPHRPARRGRAHQP